MTTIYHNPRCSKSRQTLALLQDNGIEPQIIEYLKTPLSEDQIDQIINLLNCEPQAILRKKEAEYKQAGLSNDATRDQIVTAVAAYPKLLERPIVIHNNQARIGRPPERVMELF